MNTVAVESPELCAKCAAILEPGTGSFYRVLIEAVADPSPPRLPADESPDAIRARIRKLIRDLEGTTAQEAMDQVYRRMVIYLCTNCFSRWIENPTG
jgi:hypothetical protein